jgi:hypothetical protein
MRNQKLMTSSRTPEIYDLMSPAGSELGVKTDFLLSMYKEIDAKASQLAPVEMRNELLISQDGVDKTTFHVKVSDRMAPHLISAIQHQIERGYGVALRSYLYKLQEQIMAQLFGNIEQPTFPKFS